MEYIRIFGFVNCFMSEDFTKFIIRQGHVTKDLYTATNIGGEQCVVLIGSDGQRYVKTVKSIVETSITLDYLRDKYSNFIITVNDDVGRQFRFKSFDEFIKETGSSAYDFVSLLRDKEKPSNGYRFLVLEERETDHIQVTNDEIEVELEKVCKTPPESLHEEIKPKAKSRVKRKTKTVSRAK